MCDGISMYEAISMALNERLLELEAAGDAGFPVETKIMFLRKVLRRLPDTADALSGIAVEIADRMAHLAG